jgi:hypothetical protein
LKFRQTKDWASFWAIFSKLLWSPWLVPIVDFQLIDFYNIDPLPWRRGAMDITSA